MQSQIESLRVPAIELTELSSDKVCFTLRNVDVSFANALRRVMIAEVPTLAIEIVSILENSSILHDEFIAHRLGLIPIDSSRIKEYRYKEECSCMDRCPRCSVEFRLDVCCRNEETLLVTHLDLVGTNPKPGSPVPVPFLSEISSVNDAIPIVKLKQNQRLKCHLIATKGMGKLHAKWIPTATAVFRHEPDIVINETLLEGVPLEIQREIAESCPCKVFTCQEDKYTRAYLQVVKEHQCIFCDECIVTAKERGYPDLIKVEHKSDVFHFVVEPTGALPPEQIVELAFEILESKLQCIFEETAKLEMLPVKEAKTAAASHIRMRHESQKMKRQEFNRSTNIS